LLFAHFETLDNRFQAVDEIGLVVLSKGRPCQIKGDLPPTSHSAQQKLTDLLSEVISSIMRIAEPAELERCHKREDGNVQLKDKVNVSR
jgi:hypothetical protein